MRKNFTLLLAFALFYTTGNTQQKKFKHYEFGGEGGLTIDYLNIKDPDDYIRSSHYLTSGLGGPKLRRYWSEKWFTEAAILFKENTFGIRLRNGSDVTFNDSKIVMIPIRAGIKWKLSPKLNLSLITGVAPTFTQIFQDGSSGINYPGEISLTYAKRDNYKKTYVTVQSGVHLSHLIKKRISLETGLNYYMGFNTVETTDVNYTTNNGISNNAEIIRKGSFINYNLGVAYIFDLKSKIR